MMRQAFAVVPARIHRVILSEDVLVDRADICTTVAQKYNLLFFTILHNSQCLYSEILRLLRQFSAFALTSVLLHSTHKSSSSQSISDVQQKRNQFEGGKLSEKQGKEFHSEGKGLDRAATQIKITGKARHLM